MTEYEIRNTHYRTHEASSIPPESMPQKDIDRSELPSIIQGGMGIGVSTWRLARTVAQRGELGVVSGTAIDSVVARELQDGDPHDRRSVLQTYPDQTIVEHLLDRFYQPEGRSEKEPYDLLPIHQFTPRPKSQRILAAATYTEVQMAKEGYDGLVGMNLMAKLKRYSLPCLYGAMLAGVDAVFIGAGIPLEEAKQIPKLAAGEPASLRLDVDTSQVEDPDGPYTYDLDPANLIDDPPQLNRPAFFPIISSDALARIMDAKLPDKHIDGWVVEGPVAGGHNAPPRNKQYDDDTPIYDEKDVADLDRIRSLGKPFYLAGGYGSPEGLQYAKDVGATGIQVGSLFSLTDESGYPDHMTRRLIRGLHTGNVSVRTDGRVSPTGFPFKVLTLPGTHGEEENNQRRSRICDLGYLREPYVDDKGRLLGRCPAEPVDDYVRKGGDEEKTEGRSCLCNALMANIGLPQYRDGTPELPLYTGGDALMNLPLGSLSHQTIRCLFQRLVLQASIIVCFNGADCLHESLLGFSLRVHDCYIMGSKLLIIEAEIKHGIGGQQPCCSNLRTVCQDSRNRYADHVQQGNAHDVLDLGVIIMGCIARHGQKIHSPLLELVRHVLQAGQGALACLLNQCLDARGHLRIIVHHQVDVIAVVFGWSGSDHPTHQVHCGPGPHSAQDSHTFGDHDQSATSRWPSMDC